MSIKWTKVIPIIFILGCGTDCQCVIHTHPTVIKVAQELVAEGYPMSCCPVTFCTWGKDCPSQLTGCGLARMDSSGCCKELFVDVSMSRKGCKDIERVLRHEMEHEFGMVD